MSGKRFKAEEIVNKLREADVLIAQGRTVAVACKQIAVTEQSYYRWRKEYGGLKADQEKRVVSKNSNDVDLIPRMAFRFMSRDV
jgi:putative transposase